MSAALVLHPDGRIVEVDLADGDPLELKRKHLNCDLVDLVALTDRLDMWLDDEGLYTQPFNPVATALARHHGFVWQPYHGPVMLCSVDSEGNSIALDVHQIRALLTHLMDITA